MIMFCWQMSWQFHFLKTKENHHHQKKNVHSGKTFYWEKFVGGKIVKKGLLGEKILSKKFHLEKKIQQKAPKSVRFTEGDRVSTAVLKR